MQIYELLKFILLITGIIADLLLYAAAAAAKSLQSCPTLCDPIDGSPPGSPIPGILQARTLEWESDLNSRANAQSCVSTHEHLSVPFTLSACWPGPPTSPHSSFPPVRILHLLGFMSITCTLASSCFHLFSWIGYDNLLIWICNLNL